MCQNKIIYGNICVKALKTIDTYVSKKKRICTAGGTTIVAS